MSFSSEAKLEAIRFPMKKPCCRRAFISGVLLGGADVGGEDVSLYVEGEETADFAAKLVKEQYGRETVPVRIGARGVRLLSFSSKSAASFLEGARSSFCAEQLLKCEECRSAFFRGLFVGGGTVSTPETMNYHLEMKSRSKENLSDLVGLFETEEGKRFLISTRLGRQSIYSKDSDFVQEFLFFIGASKHGFAFMNAKIGHEIKNDINRRTNCETSNIARSTASAAKHIAAIRFLSERGRLSELGPDLEYTAKMRLKFPEMSLVQLGQTMTPTVSKPGLYHRLEKICSFADTVQKKEG